MGRLLDEKEMEDTTESTWLSLGSGALNTTVLGASGRAGVSPFEGVHLRPNYREGTQPLPPTENWIKDLSTHQSKTLMPSQPVPPIRKLSQASYPSPSEGRQNENHNHRKLTKLIIWITALSNSMKVWAMLCRATQDRWVMAENSDKMWSTGEGNGKPLQYSCLENSVSSTKRQKDMTLKDELPTLVGVQYATGEEQGNRSRR